MIPPGNMTQTDSTDNSTGDEKEKERAPERRDAPQSPTSTSQHESKVTGYPLIVDFILLLYLTIYFYKSKVLFIYFYLYYFLILFIYFLLVCLFICLQFICAR